MNDLTGFQRDLLYVVASLDRPHGLAIKDELNAYYETEIHHGRLYPNLDELSEQGLLQKGQADLRTNWYELSDKARQAIEDRREWEDGYLKDRIPA